MRILVVGVGALGGTIGARLLAAGLDVSFAARTEERAQALEASGLSVTGVGGDVRIRHVRAKPLAAYADPVDLVILATKADDALASAHALPPGLVLPIQNGAVAARLAERLGDRVLGGLSNLGATMIAPGRYEQRNDGHLLIANRQDVADVLSRGIRVRTTSNFRGAMWSKLLLNCSVTTLGAIAGCSMRSYWARAESRHLFERVYAEALAVARASDVVPERMLVDPIPGGPNWISDVLAHYGDLKASMLQDFERGRPTEIDVINGWVASEGARLGVPTPSNDAITSMVHRISRGELTPSLDLHRRLL